MTTIHAGSSLTSALLERGGFRHAFFTRRGGVSVPPWDTLNFAVSTGDDPAAVAENTARAARLLGVDPSRLYFASQVHGTAARVLRGGEPREDVLREVADITASATAGVACGVRTADCVPVLLADRRTGAVAAVHSGWRGTVLGAAGEGLAVLKRLAAEAAPEEEADVVAAIGPHIQRCCFEVGADVADELLRCSPAAEGVVLEGPAGEPGKRRVDLRRVVRAQLEALGLAPDAIDDVTGCTVCEPERFHSYRRDGQRGGRLLSAIVARG